MPGKFYKGRSQEKTPLQRLEFFLLRSPPNEAGSVLIFRARCSVSELGSPAVWVFSVSGFHRLFATKPVSSETSKAERWLSGNHGSIWDSWPIAFSGYPRGPRVGCETACPRHTAPNLPAETRSRTRVSREPRGHRQRRSPGWSGRDPNTQAVCGFRCWASKLTPFFHTINTIVAIFLAKVNRPISGRRPLASKAVKNSWNGPGLREATAADTLNRFLRS